MADSIYGTFNHDLRMMCCPVCACVDLRANALGFSSEAWDPNEWSCHGCGFKWRAASSYPGRGKYTRGEVVVKAQPGVPRDGALIISGNTGVAVRNIGRQDDVHDHSDMAMRMATDRTDRTGEDDDASEEDS